MPGAGAATGEIRAIARKATSITSPVLIESLVSFPRPSYSSSVNWERLIGETLCNPEKAEAETRNWNEQETICLLGRKKECFARLLRTKTLIRNPTARDISAGLVGP
jgi:hypothetical protein